MSETTIESWSFKSMLLERNAVKPFETSCDGCGVTNLPWFDVFVSKADAAKVLDGLHQLQAPSHDVKLVDWLLEWLIVLFDQLCKASSLKNYTQTLSSSLKNWILKIFKAYLEVLHGQVNCRFVDEVVETGNYIFVTELGLQEAAVFLDVLLDVVHVIEWDLDYLDGNSRKKYKN